MHDNYLIRVARQFKKTRGPLGLLCALALSIHQILHWLGWDLWQIIALRPRGCQHKLFMRVPDSSDVDVLFQVFVEREYHPLHDIPDPKLIVDCGANVGYSTIYFLNRFPTAEVIAIEPDPENFRICQMNLARYYPRVRLLHAAIWGERAQVAVQRGSFADGRHWATQVRQKQSGDTECVSALDLNSLLEMTGNTPVDLLKIDIERSELELFRSSPYRWLPSIRNIAIELHDDECKEVFFGALAKYRYDVSVSGELTICRNLRRRAESLN